MAARILSADASAKSLSELRARVRAAQLLDRLPGRYVVRALLLSPLLGLTPGIIQIVLLMAAVALLATATSALGVLMASRIRSVETFQYVFQFALFPLFFLSGAFFVLDRVPPWIAFVANVNPLTYAIDLFRHILYADIELGDLSRELLLVNSAAYDVLIIAVISIVLLTASVVSFARLE